MADGKLSIEFDGSTLKQGLDEAESDIDGLVAPLEDVQEAAEGATEAIEETGEAAAKTGESAKSSGNRFAAFRGAIAKVFGDDGALSQKNMRTAFSSMRAIVGGSRAISQGMNQIADAGTSVGDKVTASMNVAGSAVAAFATGGPIALALTVVASLAQQIAIAMDAAEKEAEAAKEAFDAMAESAASAGKSIRLMQLEEQKSQVLIGLRKMEAQREIAKQQMADAQNLRDRQDKFAKEGDARSDERERARQIARIEGNKKAVDSLTKSIEQQQKALGIYTAQAVAQQATESAGSIQQTIDELKEASSDAVAAIEKESKKRRGRGEKKAKKAKAKKAPEPGDPIDAYAAYYKEQVAEQKRFLAEERAIEERKAQEEADRSAARVEQAKNEADLIAAVDAQLAEKKAEIRIKLEEQEKQAKEARLAQIKDDLEIGRIGLQTITGQLFEMAKAGEVSAEALLQATLNSIGQHMVAQGTQFIFEGAAKTLAQDPSGPGLMAIGAAEVSAGLSLGAASGAMNAPSPGNVPTAAPSDTRQTRAAAAPGGDSGGPVIIRFEGDVYDKRGVANVLNQGLGMARHRRLRGA